MASMVIVVVTVILRIRITIFIILLLLISLVVLLVVKQNNTNTLAGQEGILAGALEGWEGNDCLWRQSPCRPSRIFCRGAGWRQAL